MYYNTQHKPKHKGVFMSIDDLKLKKLIVQIELAELRQIISAKEDTFKALEWQYHNLTKESTHENDVKATPEIINNFKEVSWVFNPNIGVEDLMTDEECAIEEKIYDEFLQDQAKEDMNSDETTHSDYIAEVEKEETLDIAVAAQQEFLLDPIVDIEAEEKEDVLEIAANNLIEDLGIEPLSVDALSIMAIKYYKKTGEAVTDIIEERFNVKSLHKLNDVQNCALQLILRG